MGLIHLPHRRGHGQRIGAPYFLRSLSCFLLCIPNQMGSLAQLSTSRQPSLVKCSWRVVRSTRRAQSSLESLHALGGTEVTRQQSSRSGKRTLVCQCDQRDSSVCWLSNISMVSGDSGGEDDRALR